MTGKERADVSLVRRGLAQSREKAQAMIMAGEVYVGERKICKSSETVNAEEEITLRGVSDKYVSRGAYKLEKAVQVFGIDFSGRTVMDVGASTGGFTDVCLRNGAKHVYAIDVGYGQLDWKLRNDPRVTVMERVNARYLTKEHFNTIPDIAVMDVSFISIRLIIPTLFSIMGEQGILYTLIKPQFEAGKNKVGKNGVVRSEETHAEVLNEIIQYAESNGFHVCRISYSPITGPEGNIEYLAEIHRKKEGDAAICGETISQIVRESHQRLYHIP